MPRHELQAGRAITRDGMPFITIQRSAAALGHPTPTELDEAAVAITELLNAPTRVADMVSRMTLTPWVHGTIVGLLVDLFGGIPKFNAEAFAMLCGEPAEEPMPTADRSLPFIMD